MQHSNRIAHVHRRTNYCVDAHVAHRAYDYDFLDISGFQLLFQIGFSEGVDVFFYDYRFITLWSYIWLNFRTLGSLRKDRSAFSGLMSYVENRKPLITEVADHSDSILDSGVDAGQRQLASGQVFVLQINYYKATFHERSPVNYPSIGNG
ncbi:Uncharacterized protein PFLU_2504 [Pseudomonas [fluorescens] SBW25]|uniref:Uncharacterized protein n=1 Tax=Pseudomonas fluorescens (strain SBW25) TaxID=216595 RepID=C3K9B6_PSEFS|nr:Uncharacterized protein PFLU_2504 [Pseudomonas fluorescens SBW25]